MEKKDIPYLSTAELADLIRQKEVSPVEVTESYLERIDDLNFKFNSYLTVCHTEALQAAKEAEQSISRGNYLGPMHGIPVAVKDQLWTKASAPPSVRGSWRTSSPKRTPLRSRT